MGPNQTDQSTLRWKVYDMGGGQIVARPSREAWPAAWPDLPEVPTWEGEASTGPEAINLAAAWCFLKGIPFSRTEETA